MRCVCSRWDLLVRFLVQANGDLAFQASGRNRFTQQIPDFSHVFGQVVDGLRF